MFLTKNEILISKEYIKNGYVVRNVSDKESLLNLSENIKLFVKKYLRDIKKIKVSNIDDENIFYKIHKIILKKEINFFRNFLIKKISSHTNLRFYYYNLAKDYLDVIVGNELSMQRRLNLSIQMPNDPSSILNIHTDTLSGDSPFEVVLWLPLVDCYKTKRMFLLPPKKSNDIYSKGLKKLKIKDTRNLHNYCKKDLEFIDIKFGQFLLFNQNLFHGGVVNKELTTRWSMNCRFKSVFTPYKEKKIGEFFEPITLKPATISGVNYSRSFIND
jgi:sporadic carbohydrate cluster 2OG-Fe(II) oxygenase